MLGRTSLVSLPDRPKSVSPNAGSSGIGLNIGGNSPRPESKSKSKKSNKDDQLADDIEDFDELHIPDADRLMEDHQRKINSLLGKISGEGKRSDPVENKGGADEKKNALIKNMKRCVLEKEALNRFTSQVDNAAHNPFFLFQEFVKKVAGFEGKCGGVKVAEGNPDRKKFSEIWSSWYAYARWVIMQEDVELEKAGKEPQLKDSVVTFENVKKLLKAGCYPTSEKQFRLGKPEFYPNTESRKLLVNKEAWQITRSKRTGKPKKKVEKALDLEGQKEIFKSLDDKESMALRSDNDMRYKNVVARLLMAHLDRDNMFETFKHQADFQQVSNAIDYLANHPLPKKLIQKPAEKKIR